MIKKALLCDMLASHDTYRERVRSTLALLDTPDSVASLRGPSRIVANACDQLVYTLQDKQLDTSKLVGCAIDLLVAAFVLRNGRP